MTSLKIILKNKIKIKMTWPPERAFKEKPNLANTFKNLNPILFGRQKIPIVPMNDPFCIAHSHQNENPS